MHANEEFKCSKCEFTSKSMRYLNTHAKCKHGNDVYVCQTCGKQFKWPESLHKHVQNHKQLEYLYLRVLLNINVIFTFIILYTSV